jgi:chromosome segregation ATPase
MVMTSHERQIRELQQARTQADAVLRGLVEAKARCEATLAEDGRGDLFKSVAGRSSLEAGIAEARRVVETLDRRLGELAQGTDDEDEELAHADGLRAVVVAGRLSRGYRGMAARAVAG